VDFGFSALIVGVELESVSKIFMFAFVHWRKALVKPGVGRKYDQPRPIHEHNR
jgi:hypothetical protein